MALTYGFYDSLNHDRLYNAQQMSAIFDGIINDGVFMSVGNQLHTVAGSGMQVIVKSGRAWFNNTWTLNDQEYPLTIAAADVLLTRIDAVVLEVNSEQATRANSLKIVKGTPASTPAKPTLTNTSTVHQHALAYVTVAKNTSAITNSMIEIVVGKTETPYVTAILQTTDITDLFNQWQDQFTVWFETVKGTLDGDVALNLQNQIDKNSTSINNVTIQLSEYEQTYSKEIGLVKSDVYSPKKKPLKTFARLGLSSEQYIFTHMSVTNKTGCYVDITSKKFIIYQFNGSSVKITEYTPKGGAIYSNISICYISDKLIIYPYTIGNRVEFMPLILNENNIVEGTTSSFNDISTIYGDSLDATWGEHNYDTGMFMCVCLPVGYSTTADPSYIKCIKYDILSDTFTSTIVYTTTANDSNYYNGYIRSIQIDSDICVGTYLTRFAVDSNNYRCSIKIVFVNNSNVNIIDHGNSSFLSSYNVVTTLCAWMIKEDTNLYILYGSSNLFSSSDHKLYRIVVDCVDYDIKKFGFLITNDSFGISTADSIPLTAKPIKDGLNTYRIQSSNSEQIRYNTETDLIESFIITPLEYDVNNYLYSFSDINMFTMTSSGSNMPYVFGLPYSKGMTADPLTFEYPFNSKSGFSVYRDCLTTSKYYGYNPLSYITVRYMKEIYEMGMI